MLVDIGYDLQVKVTDLEISAWESAHSKVVEPGVSKNQTGSNLVNPYNVAVSRIVSDVFASDAP